MNVYPLVWRFPVPLLGHIEITGYGIMMMVGFLMGGWLIALELRRRGLHEEYAADITVAAVIGGIIGAKLWYWAMNGGSLFSRGGLVWYGGFVGGAAAVMINGWRKQVPLRWTFQIAAPSLARLLHRERRLRPPDQSPVGSQVPPGTATVNSGEHDLAFRDPDAAWH